MSIHQDPHRKGHHIDPEEHLMMNDESQTATKETILSSVFVKNDVTGSVDVVEKPIQKAINVFLESAQLCIEVLDTLKDIHPFIAAPVLAFKIVVNLELKRRGNNTKVVAIKTQMMSMMCALYQLRNVTDDIGKDGKPLEGRLQALMAEMEKWIMRCHSACDTYMNKSFLRKYLKASIYEEHLASYASRFSELKSDLLFAISIHTTLGVDSANAKLDDQRTTLADMQLLLQQILVHLDTPREKDVRIFIARNRGASACVQNDAILTALMEKTGENLKTGLSVSDIKEDLFHELAENIDTVIKQNFSLFSGKLDLQRQQIEEATNILKRQENELKAYFSGGHERIADPGWKNTVKARNFVLALRDFFTGDYDNFNESERVMHAHATNPHQLLHPPLNEGLDSEDLNSYSSNDQWAKTYINVAYLQPILEAIDDDGSAFINIKEVNTFTLSRPKGWTLLQWLAYWAAGWQSSISNYKDKIYRALRKMYKLLQKVLPVNHRILDAYLHSVPFVWLQSLLSSTRSTAESGVTITLQLAKLTEELTAMEEKKLRENLEKISYVIDSTATVSLVIGPGRIERYIYPLIYLLLERHIKVFQLARKHVFHYDEMDTFSSSLQNVCSAFDNRLQDIAASFKQMHLDAERQFDNFAFGMFKSSYGGITRHIYKNTLRVKWEDLSPDPGDYEGLAEVPTNIPIDILKYDPLDLFEVAPPSPFEVTVQPDNGPNIAQGNWSGYLTWSDNDPHEGLFRILFNATLDDGTTTGKADAYTGSLELEASVLPREEASEYNVDVVMIYNDGNWIRCIGKLNTANGSILGEWYMRRFPSELKPVPGSEAGDIRFGTFEFYRTPADLARFRYSREEFENNKSRARWAFACTAIRFTVQRRLFTRDYVLSQFNQGRRFKELVIKRLVSDGGYTRRTEFTPEDKKELAEIASTICPFADQFYYSFARFIINRITYHFGVTCDLCGREIQQSRLICIICKSNDNNSLDFCIECSSVESVPTCQAHTGSHSLLRGDRFLHDCDRAWVMPEAKWTSKRLKEAFKSHAATKNLHSDNYYDSMATSEDGLKCWYCDDAISLPCWVCLECPVDVLICDNCDRLTQLPELPEKLVSSPPSLAHMMLRITDDKPVDDLEDERLFRVEKKLVGVTSRVEEKLDVLENMMHRQTKGLETRLDALAVHYQTADVSVRSESKADLIDSRLEALEARFATVEKLLMELLSTR